MLIGERMAGFIGGWTGENRLRMMPDDDFSASASTAAVGLAAGGNVATLTYTWSDFDGVAQEGLLVLSDGPMPGRVDAVWADSWHQHPRWMAMAGSSANAEVELSGTYGEGDETGGWRIRLHLDDPEALVMSMENAYPVGGDSYEVVRARWRRG